MTLLRVVDCIERIKFLGARVFTMLQRGSRRELVVEAIIVILNAYHMDLRELKALRYRGLDLRIE